MTYYNNIQNVNNKMECENSNTSSNDSTIINNNKNVSNNNTLIHPQMGYDLEQLKMNFYKDLQMNYDDNDNNDVLPDKNNKADKLSLVLNDSTLVEDINSTK